MTSTNSNKRLRNITGLILAASAIAACGGSGDSSLPESGGDAQTRSGDDASVATSTESTETTPSDTAETADTRADDGGSQAATDLVVDGRWDDGFDGVELVQAGDEITGTWADDGALEGELDGSTLTGVYFDSEITCDESRDGSDNWGTFEWVFADDGLSFDGEYQSCGVESPIEWNGTRVDGTDASDSDTSDAAGVETGLDIVDGPTRFYEIDWTIVETWRWPDGPFDDGEDVDPSEDFIYVSVDAVLPVDSVSLGIPWQWFSLVRPDGAEFQPIAAYERSNFDGVGTRIDFEPNRVREFTVTFPVDARDDFTGGYVELDQPGFEPAALGGPDAVDETRTIPVTFESTRYEGPFSRDEGVVEIDEAYWARELGTFDDGTLIDEPWLSGSRRPEFDSVFLVVGFSVTCIQVSINTGGCNVQVDDFDIDGELKAGGNLNGSVGYDNTKQFWTVVSVPVDAEAVSVRLGGDSSFEVSDLAPLAELDPSV